MYHHAEFVLCEQKHIYCNQNVCKSMLSVVQNPKIYTENESTLCKNQ